MPPDEQLIPLGKRRKPRDLAQAITLRPAEVFLLYGIPTSTTSQYCNDPNPERRMPSLKIPGRRGRKGLRLIDHAELKVWLNKWRCRRAGSCVDDVGSVSTEQ